MLEICHFDVSYLHGSNGPFPAEKGMLLQFIILEEVSQ